MQWTILRVAYFDRQNAAVLTDCVATVVSQAQQNPAFHRCFASRHWLFGPHIDIYLAYPDPVAAAPALQQWQQQISGWLNANPSLVVLDESQYLAQSKLLGEAELLAGPYEPLLQDNSVTQVEYQPDVALLRDIELVKLKEDYCHQMMPIAFDLLRLKQQDKTAFLLKLAEMLAIVGHTFAFEGLKRGHLSLRSHLEFFLANRDPSGKLRQHYQQQELQYRTQMDLLLQRLHHQTASLQFYREQDPLLASWTQLVHQLKSQVTDIVLRKYDLMRGQQHFDQLANQRMDVDTNDQPYFKQGQFFELMYSQGSDSIMSSREFLIYRTMVNHFYVSLPLLGVSPLDKHLLCALIADASERYYQINWQQMLQKPAKESSHVTTAA